MFFAGGGTGGHIFPAVAVIEALREMEPSVDPLFILGGSRGSGLLEKYSIPWRSIPVRGMPRRSAVSLPLFYLRLVAGVVSGFALMMRHRPAAVVAMGGYASTPVAFAAKLLRVPLLAAEQNAVAGFATRWNARFARTLFLAYGEAKKTVPAGVPVELTGNPVRREILRGERERAVERWGLDRERRTVLVTGGSQGARGMNRIVLEALKMWKEGEGVQVLFQTGEGDYQKVRESCSRIAPLVRPFPFLDDMGDAYAAADVVVCRAGASTLSEITAVGLPAILVPFPGATDRHQSRNAELLEAHGAALRREESELTAERLLEDLRGILENEERRLEMKRLSLELGRPDAAERIAKRVLEAAGKGSRIERSVEPGSESGRKSEG